VAQMIARPWLAPGIVLVSTGAMLQAVAIGGAAPTRTLLVVWFLAVCPGWGVMGVLRLADPWLEVATAIALSLAIDVLVTATLSYGGRWSPTVALLILASVSVGGALAQLWLAARRSSWKVSA
jgi:hypothetical protein